MHRSVQEFTCYIQVKGEATDPDDEGLSGIYAVSVSASEPVKLAELTADQEDKISQAVLDAFHDKNGIEEVDDFAISVFLENGKEISEAGNRVDSEFRVSAYYWGSVNDADVPEALVAALSVN